LAEPAEIFLRHGMITRTRLFIMPTKPVSLIDKIKEECQLRHFSRSTFESYAHWVRRYYKFHRRPPRELNGEHVRQFLAHLAKSGMSASSQNQALNALVFTYGKVLRLPLGDIGEFARAKRPMPKKLNGCSRRCTARTGSWPNCSTGPECGCMNA